MNYNSVQYCMRVVTYCVVFCPTLSEVFHKHAYNVGFKGMIPVHEKGVHYEGRKMVECEEM